MYSLENSVIGTDISSRCNAQSANKTRTKIACDIAIKIREHNHIKLRGIHNEVHTERIDDIVIEFDATFIIGSNLPCRT